MWNNFYQLLPHPEDKHPAPLRPSKRKDGIYVLTREPYDTEILFTEPDGDSYLLETLECEQYLKGLLRIAEVDAEHIMDVLWNFYYAEFNIDEPEVVCSRPSLTQGLINADS